MTSALLWMNWWGNPPIVATTNAQLYHLLLKSTLTYHASHNHLETVVRMRCAVKYFNCWYPTKVSSLTQYHAQRTKGKKRSVISVIFEIGFSFSVFFFLVALAFQSHEQLQTCQRECERCLSSRFLLNSNAFCLFFWHFLQIAFIYSCAHCMWMCVGDFLAVVQKTQWHLFEARPLTASHILTSSCNIQFNLWACFIAQNNI